MIVSYYGHPAEFQPDLIRPTLIKEDTSMFGSDAKKQTTGKAPWALQILTTEHLIEGSFYADKNKVDDEDIFTHSTEVYEEGETISDTFVNIRLLEARLQPTGNLTTPVQTFPGLELPTFDLVVAIIPADPASLQSAQKAYKGYRYPIEAVIYAGPYLMRGKVLSDYADGSRSPFTDTQFLPLVDVEIDCQVQGARLSAFRAPWLLLNGSQVHAYWLNGITAGS
jgi:hypothetical protein